MVAGTVGDDRVDRGQGRDRHEGDPAELALVGCHDHPVGTLARGPLHLAFALVVVRDSAVGVDARDAHHEGVAVVPAQCVLGGGADQAELAGPQLAAGEHHVGGRFGDQLEGHQQAGRDDRQAQCAAFQRFSHREGCAARVENQGLAGADQIGDGVGDVALLLRGVGDPRLERRLGVLTLQRDRTADDPSDHAEGLERLDIATDGHLGDIELRGQLGVRNLAVGTHALLDAVPASLRVHRQALAC